MLPYIISSTLAPLCVIIGDAGLINGKKKRREKKNNAQKLGQGHCHNISKGYKYISFVLSISSLHIHSHNHACRDTLKSFIYCIYCIWRHIWRKKQTNNFVRTILLVETSWPTPVVSYIIRTFCSWTFTNTHTHTKHVRTDHVTQVMTFSRWCS